mgnify:CR=1 FL=1
MLTFVSQAETTISDNLLNNNTFDENTNGWTLSDSNVKRDANSYSDAGNSPTIRFKGQTSTITQSVDTSSLEADKEITGLTIKYHGYGCGNTGNQWCTAEADDTIVTNVTFSDGTNSEVSTNTVAVPFEDGWTHHSFTQSINDTFITDETSITFTLQGIDTGNSNSWLGPITDNYELLVTYQDYVTPVVEPVVIEPVVIEPVVIEPIVVIEPTVIGAIDLSTEVTLDLIQDVQIMPEIPTIELTPEIGNMDIGVDMNMDMPTDMTIEMPTDISTNAPVEIANINMPISVPTVEIQVIEVAPQIETTQEIQEIRELPEINIEEPIELESEPIELEPEIVDLDMPEELKDLDMQEDMEIAKNDESKQEAEAEAQTNDDSDLSESTESELESEVSSTETNADIEPVATTKDGESGSKKSSKKEKKKVTKKKVVDKPKVVNKKTKTNKPKTVVKATKPSKNAGALGQIDVVTLVTLTSIPETITIQETVLLTQEMVYEQDISAFTSSATYDSLISSSSSRWVRMVDVRPKHTFGGYGR